MDCGVPDPNAILVRCGSIAAGQRHRSRCSGSVRSNHGTSLSGLSMVGEFVTLDVSRKAERS
jgi:hypothetical protein